MSVAGQDSCQWLSVTEETLFLHDGLIRLTDLVELPHDVNSSQEHENEVITFDIKNPSELSERLLNVCGTQNNAYSKLLEYRLNALKGFWNAQNQIAVEEQNERDSASQEETIALLKKQGLLKESEQASFATRISVLLVLPLLQSQSRLDPSLCGVTAEVLCNCLRDCAPLSLAKEPSDCLKGLENLLCGWLGECLDSGTAQNVDDPHQRENVASALVALAVARGHLKTFIHTVHLLQKTVDLKRLPVSDILLKLLETEGGPGQPTAVLGSKHVLCWGFEELLNHATDESGDKDKEKEKEGNRSVTCDGVFLCTTSSSGRGLIKIGTGLHGSLRGCVYIRNPNLGAGKVAFGDGVLLHRPCSFDQEADLANLCHVIDQYTLQPEKTIATPESYIQPGAHTTVAFCSDGSFFYWLWCPGTLTEKGVKGLPVFMEVFRYDPEEQIVVPVQPRVMLQRKEETAGKSLSDTLLSRLRPHRGSCSTATLVSLTGGETITIRKEEAATSTGSTSCGIALKTLVKTPIFCDGNSVVLLNTLPGGSNSSTARSLFGSGGSLSGLRTLATNICFNVRDGQYNCRSDLMDAPTCALARGAAVTSLGSCYDMKNNCLWTCSNDWIDQYYNPGHQAPHHINKRLCIPAPVQLTQAGDNRLPVSEVIKQILQHVGGMCLHQMNSDLLHTPLGKYILQQHPVDLVHLKQVCDILESSILTNDNQIIICALIILQLTFKVSVFRIEKPEVNQLVKRTSYLVWQLLTSSSKTADEDSDKRAIQREACNVICIGLRVLYHDVQDMFQLLSQLLSGGGQNDSMDNLRDLILIDFAEQLRNQVTNNEEVKYMRLTDELVHYILKICVKESCQLLRQVHNAEKSSLEQLLASIPMASASLRYMMALQSHLLRDTVLCKVVKDDLESVEKQNEILKGLQIQILSLAFKIFKGSCQVLEVFLETCNAIITHYKDDLEYRLQALERIAKATVLGHLLPVVLTAATHPNLQCLSLADALMQQLVHLVVLTSQAALLLKSQVQAILEDDGSLVSDTDVIDLIGDSINLNGSKLDGNEEQGFLADLKIPAPWASGKTVESIHPVRDNYKFKESVHIPGARCLYLRFDPRCCSQYDYDKLVVYAGPNTNAKKLSEYGGNTCGFGSRSVLGSGWPKDLVKVEGDTVTFSFEMRSGREHNTPDKAMWGFFVTVRAQESVEEVSGGLPFLADLALGLSVLACTQLQLLYQGPEKTTEEVACENLLKSKLLRRCVWQSKSGPSFTTPHSPRDIPIQEDVELSIKSQPHPSSPVLPRVRMPSEVVHGLRRICNKNPPQLRPSIREVIKPDVLEERIVSAVVKHLSLTDTVQFLSVVEQEQTEEFCLLNTVMEEVFRRIDSLFRQLQHLGEVEQRWHNEVLDHCKCNTDSPPFFHDYHLQETKLKELGTLCYVKGVVLDQGDLEDAVKILSEKFHTALLEDESTVKIIMCRTKQIVEGLLARLDLLLHVNISPAEGIHLSRTVSQSVNVFKHGVMVRSDTDVLHAVHMFGRSLSAPSGVDHLHDDSVIDISRLQRKRQAQRQGPVSMFHDLMEDEVRDRPPHIILLDQLFSFIGSTPEKAISCEKFLTAAEIRWRRGNTRKKALVHMKELLTAACRVGGATHLVAAVTSVLQHGPKVEELTCGGMVNEVREAFSETMTSVVQLAARYPIACCNSIGLLCIVPYTRAEEKCLVRSGLVHLLDKLCNLVSYRSDGLNMESQSTQQKVSTMAWAGFQVLANRCVMWETEDGSIVDDLEHSGLARQVSILLTNHLARATECSGNEAAGSEALQEVLSLLNNLSRSRMGKAILSQPACVSKLLSLLLDQRPSPKLVLIILQLCRVALPLMCAVDCEAVELPAWGQHLYSSYWSSSQPVSDPPAKIVSLLLAKLGDFLVAGDSFTLSSRRASTDSESSKQGATGGDMDKSEDSDVQAGRLSVFIHKREDQLSHEVIQPLLSSENRPFRLGGGANMERVVRMDREMTKHGKAEVSTDDAMTALRKAAKWAQMGLVVSTGPPIDITQAESSGDKKKTEKDVVCRDKNAELARTDPVRAFISGHVANSMAAEVIALLHSLLMAPESSTAQSWSESVQRVVSNALSCLPLLQNSIDSLGSPRCNIHQIMSMAKLANAALCALGGFKETIKPGCHVKITGDGTHQSIGQVMSVSEVTGTATVKLDEDQDTFYAPRYSDMVQVPITRLQPVRSEMYNTHQLPMTESIVNAVQAIVLPQDEAVSPLQQVLPLSGDGNSLTNQTSRILAELQARACMVLSLYLQDINFAKEFIDRCGSGIDMLKSLAKECGTGDRLSSVESQCTKLRMLYRDCAKPPPPPNKVDNRVNKEMVWDTGRSFPPVRSCLFSYSLTGITFLGDPSAGSGLPRGTLVYANMAIPQQAPAFYWELEICSFGDAQDESGAVISFGFAPPAEKKDGAWTNPVGTCLFLNNGKAVHYNGASLLQWRSVRLDVTLCAGDIVGIGWERTGEAPVQEQTPKGQVYFTYNGRRLPSTVDDVSGCMNPVVHIQKKNTRLRANFGARPFSFAEGQQHRDAADAASDLTREIRESFGALPFHTVSDSDSDGQNTPNASVEGCDSKQICTLPGPPCKTASIPEAKKEYNSESCHHYKLFKSYDNFVHSGPLPHTQPTMQDDESDEENGEDDKPNEDHYALLVKAWEQKVFPVIRRRFRNEAERKDGLEQIRGALQLGMIDIARQTVEFLYEENGGMPRDLHLPTIDDIKEDLAKFTIERVRKGTTVVIRNPPGTRIGGATVLPKFAVRSMLRTFGLTGTILDIDTNNELVQVESYMRSEGVLVRFWYPIDMLEKPPQGLRKSTITGGQILDTSNVHIHRELLKCESVLTRMYCRTALLELIDHCNSPAMEVISCSASLGSGMAASAALLQELDIENLQLLSNELLCPAQPNGTIIAASLDTAMSQAECLASHSCSMTNLFYNNGDRLHHELAVAISRAANQGEDYLIELTNQICICLQTSPEMFPYDEFPVTEMKVNTDLHFPGAACVIVSCKMDPNSAKKETSLYKSPWARVFTYTGHRVKKTGQATKQEVVSYPRDTTSTSNQNEQYTPAILPCDRVHLRLGVSPSPGIILTLHALPPQFLLAVAYIETLVTESHGCGTKSCGQKSDGDNYSVQKQTYPHIDAPQSLWNLDNIVITPPVFVHMIEIVFSFMWKTDIPAVIKEYLFQLIAQSLRILHYSEGGNGSVLPVLQPHLCPSKGFLVQLRSELKYLYEEEIKDWTTATTASGRGMGLGVTDSGRFSTYFHSLMEANLAIAEISTPNKGSVSGAIGGTGWGSGVSPGATGSSISPSSATKRKKAKIRKEKTVSSTKKSPRVSESDNTSGSSLSVCLTTPSLTSTSSSSLDSSSSSSLAVSSASGFLSSKSSTSVSVQGVKPEDMLWFHRALTVSQILRCIGFGEKHGEGALTDAVMDAAQSLFMPTSHLRLLIVTGIPTHLDPVVVKRAITKVCNSNGCGEKSEVFLPGKSENICVKDDSDQTMIDSKHSELEKSSNTLSSSEESNLVQKEKSEPKSKPKLEGYAIINVTSKTKLDSVKKALFKSKQMLEGLSVDPNELVDVPEEVLSVSAVSQALLAEEHANKALEHYLMQKIFTDDNCTYLTDEATLAFTEVFHSCFIVEQRNGSQDVRQDSGYICLGKDQILQSVTDNQLYTFFGSIRPPKKSLAEQVMQVLRKYGIVKTADKELSPVTDKNGKGKVTKKISRPMKEKVVMAVVDKNGSKEKKTKSKESPEKPYKDQAAAEAIKPSVREESKFLTLDGFLQFSVDMAKEDVRSVWKALFSCGFDLYFERCACVDVSQAQQMSREWTYEMDCALVKFVNKFTRKLAIASSRIHPHEIYLGQCDLINENFSYLQGTPIESIRVRFALLQSLNNTLETFFLPLVDLCPADIFSRSTAALLSKVRGVIFYDTKVSLVNRILNATAKRKPDQAAPEINLDPLETIGGEVANSVMTKYCQAYRQLSNIPSSQLCVRLASGGDPTYSFNVRLTGEEVHGTSGSFRHFQWQIAREIQNPTLGILIPCNNSDFKGRNLLKPGNMTFSEEKLLQFFGQLLGVTIRADIPLGLDLLTPLWKVLLAQPLDPVMDLQAADQLTYNYIKKIEMVESESELQALCADVYPRFVYSTLTGEDVELVRRGRHILICWENRQEYVDAICALRMKELSCQEKIRSVWCGLATIIPLQLLTLMSPLDLELRTCGLPEVDLDFLKAHTMYQVGLMESDLHIEYFWNALETFSQEDLCRFIKFACNQERIPQTCPCRDGGNETTHVPPYPMKIAPPDGSGSPDSRYVRAETCMFMIKLPQYSTQEITTQRLLYAINCREDPLSG